MNRHLERQVEQHGQDAAVGRRARTDVEPAVFDGQLDAVRCECRDDPGRMSRLRAPWRLGDRPAGLTPSAAS
jgi:hypothetical protein